MAERPHREQERQMKHTFLLGRLPLGPVSGVTFGGETLEVKIEDSQKKHLLLGGG